MDNLRAYDSKPWYQQFWPWFLIALPATVVVAAIITVFIAFRGADTEVNDDYYRDGLAFEQILEHDLNARKHGLQANFLWDDITGEIIVSLSQKSNSPRLNYPKQLQLQLIHPGDQAKDSEIKLNRTSVGSYHGEIDALIPNRYYLQLVSLPENGSNIVWRLQGELDFTQTQQIELHYR